VDQKQNTQLLFPVLM